MKKIGYRLSTSQITEYKKYVHDRKRNVICIIDHPYFDCFIDINKKFRILTIYCGQNLESFDSFIYDRWSYKNAMSSSIEFADEYNCLSRCDHRLMNYFNN